MISHRGNVTVKAHFRTFARLLSGLLPFVGNSAYGQSDPVPAEAPPNILFIFSDDHANHTISAYGSVINKTPNIDRLAKEGAIFLNSFCANSICQPSRASVLTGKHSHRNGVLGNGSRWDARQTIFPRLLQAVGYQTALYGKWHLVPAPTDEFETWEVMTGFGGQGAYYNPDFLSPAGITREPGFSTDIITDKAIGWLQEKRDPSRPFLLMVQYKAPHVKRVPALRFLDTYEGEEIPEPSTLFDDYSTRQPYAANAWMKIRNISNYFPPDDFEQAMKKDPMYQRMSADQKQVFFNAYKDRNAEYERLKADGTLKGWKAARSYAYQRFIKDYLRCVDGIDENVGRLLDHLEGQGLSDNTIVIYSSDQSYFLGDHGWAEKRWMYEESLTMPLIMRWPAGIAPGSRIKEMVQNIDYAPTFLEIAGVKVPEAMQGHSLLPLLEGKIVNDWRDSIYYHYYDHGGHNVPRHDGVRTERYKLIHFYTDDVYELYDLQEDPDEIKSVHEHAEYAPILNKMRIELQRLRNHYGVPEDVFLYPYPRGKNFKRN
jgi:arylsulfatase A-like enzyme